MLTQNRLDAELIPCLGCCKPSYNTSPMASRHRILAEAKPNQFKVVGSGSFADVYRVVDTEIAFKIPFERGELDAIEKRIYERLGTHRR